MSETQESLQEKLERYNASTSIYRTFSEAVDNFNEAQHDYNLRKNLGNYLTPNDPKAYIRDGINSHRIREGFLDAKSKSQTQAIKDTDNNIVDIVTSAYGLNPKEGLESLEELEPTENRFTKVSEKHRDYLEAKRINEDNNYETMVALCLDQVRESDMFESHRKYFDGLSEENIRKAYENRVLKIYEQNFISEFFVEKEGKEKPVLDVKKLSRYIAATIAGIKDPHKKIMKTREIFDKYQETAAKIIAQQEKAKEQS